MGMAQTCEYVDPESEVKSHIAEMRMTFKHEEVEWAIHVCPEHVDCIIEVLRRAGFRPTSMAVGKSRRGVYLSHRGVPFTASDVRNYLAEQDRDDFPKNGRLSMALIDEYAAEH